MGGQRAHARGALLAAVLEGIHEAPGEKPEPQQIDEYPTERAGKVINIDIMIHVRKEEAIVVPQFSVKKNQLMLLLE